MSGQNNRYKVKGDASNFSELVRLSQEFAKVCAVSEKRRYLSVEGMPAKLKEKLEKIGGKVSRDRRYTPE